jgi:hypothetical protein
MKLAPNSLQNRGGAVFATQQTSNGVGNVQLIGNMFADNNAV